MAGQLDALPGVDGWRRPAAGSPPVFFDELDFVLKADTSRMFLGLPLQFLELVLQFR